MLLAGVSEALHGPIGAPPWESVTAVQTRALAGAQNGLADRYVVCFAEGREFSAEDVVVRIQIAAPESVASAR